MDLRWENDTIIVVSSQDNMVVLSANKAGLLSLAHHLTALSEDNSPGVHIHLDEYNGLEDGSVELVIERID